MTSKADNHDDILTFGDVHDGKWIGLLWDDEEWLVTSQSMLPRHVRDALNEMLVSKLDLPGANEIENKNNGRLLLNPDVQLIDLDEWLRNPETDVNGQVSIDEVAFIDEDEDEDEWIVDPTPHDELQVTA